MQIPLEARLLITALLTGLIWALAPRPSTFSRAWIEPGTSLAASRPPQDADGIRP